MNHLADFLYCYKIIDVSFKCASVYRNLGNIGRQLLRIGRHDNLDDLSGGGGWLPGLGRDVSRIKPLLPRLIGQLGAHIHQLVFGQTAGFMAMGAILKAQQLGDLLQTETQALRRFHEVHPVHVLPATAANAALGFVRFRQQVLALVEPDGLDVDPRHLGEGADCEVFKLLVHGT